jgi:hypothetical protein
MLTLVLQNFTHYNCRNIERLFKSNQIRICYQLLVRPHGRSVYVPTVLRTFPTCESGSVCLWTSRIRILLSSSKIVRKTLIPTVFWLLYDILSLKNDVNVPSKRNKEKNFWKKITFLVVLKVTDEMVGSSGSISQRYGSTKSVLKCHGSATLKKKFSLEHFCRIQCFYSVYIPWSTWPDSGQTCPNRQSPPSSRSCSSWIDPVI